MLQYCFTLRMRRNAMHVAPRTASQTEVRCTPSAMLFHNCTKVEPFAFIPSISFIWDVTIIRATADVNPELTGPDTKSIRNP